MGSQFWQADFRKISGVFALALFFGATSEMPAKAQSYLENIGVPTFATQLPVENGFINGANGNLHLEIPLGSFPQRSGAPDKIVLMYDSAIWLPWNGKWNPYNTPSYTFNYINSGWRLVTSSDPGTTTSGETDSGYCSREDDYYWATYSPWIWIAPDGTQHSFPVTTVAPIYPGICGTNGSGTPNAAGYASDGSGFYISITNYTNAVVYAPDGTVAQIGPNGVGGTKTDSNGNQYKITTPNDLPQLFDTLGRAIVTETVSSDGTTVYYAVPNAQGSQSTYAAKMAWIPVSTNFGQSGILEDSQTIRIITELDLPDGTKYTFSYDSGTAAGHYGLLTAMGLPTGGTIQYSYSVYQDANSNRYLWTTSRTNSDGTWAYVPQTPLSNCASGYVDCQQQVKITKASGDQSVYTFTLNGGAWPTAVQYYTGTPPSGTLLASTTQCFSFVTLNNDGSCSYNVVAGSPGTNVHPRAATTTLAIPSGNVSATTEYGWDSNNQGIYGELTQIQEWNFGNSPTNPADRTTTMGYYTPGGNILNRPSSVTVKNSAGATVAQTLYTYDVYTYNGGTLASVTGLPGHDDTNYGTNNTARGNVTLIQNLVAGSTYLNSYRNFDTTGQVTFAYDPNLQKTTNAYGCQNAYPTAITNALNQPTTLGYDCNTGLLTSIKDANNQTTGFSYDNMARPLTTSYPDGGQTTLSYNYSGITYTGSTATKKITSSQNMVTAQLVDGLGRVNQVQLTSDPEGTDHTDTTFDTNGRIASVSNPHRSSSSGTDGSESVSYDGLDRALAVTRADGSVAHTYYGAAVGSNGGAASQLCSGYGVGYPILTVDEAGKKRQSWVDGFGRSIEADEPDSNNNLTINTCYGFDLNNNLTQVAQGSETRTFAYDMMSRLISKTEPESGTIYFYYTNTNGYWCSGNPSAVCRRVDARNITTTYSYDALNRITTQTYSDGTPGLNFAYDNPTFWGASLPNAIGRVVARWRTPDVSSELFGYDPVGRVTTNLKCTPVNCGTSIFSLPYSYDLLGDVTSAADGTGATISYVYDGAERPTGVTSSWVDGQHPATLAVVDPSLGYYPTGQIHVMTLGNGLTVSNVYDPRWSLERHNVNSSGTVINGWEAEPSGTVEDWGWARGTWGSTNNGNITIFYGYGTQNFSRYYSYDVINRVATMSSSSDPAGCTGLSWTNDRWGNRTAQSVTGGSCNNWSATYNSHNQITGFGYDAAGNLTSDGLHTYFYDAENRITQVDGTAGNCSTATACYIYDVSGQRVEKKSGGVTTDYIRDLSGRVVTELQGGAFSKGYAYFNGLLAQYSGGMTYFVHGDHLSSTRLLTGMNKSVAECYDYLPFGEQLSYSGCTNTGITSHKFAGDERDSETGSDYAFARYYGSRYGSFLSTDPVGGDPSDPQSLNRYPYVRDNPLNLTDPSGLFSVCVGDCGGFDFPIFGIGFGGGGDWSSGRNGPQSPMYIPPGVGTSPNDPNSNDPFGGETNGIPNGLQVPTLGLAGILLPSAACQFNGCVTVGSGLLQGPLAPCVLAPEACEGLLAWLARLLWPIALAKGGQSQNPLPTWTKDRPRPGETADEFAKRVCKEQYPPDGAGCGSGPGSEYNKIRKWAQEWINKHK